MHRSNPSVSKLWWAGKQLKAKAKEIGVCVTHLRWKNYSALKSLGFSVETVIRSELNPQMLSQLSMVWTKTFLYKITFCQSSWVYWISNPVSFVMMIVPMLALESEKNCWCWLGCHRSWVELHRSKQCNYPVRQITVTVICAVSLNIDGKLNMHRLFLQSELSRKCVRRCQNLLRKNKPKHTHDCIPEFTYISINLANNNMKLCFSLKW